MELHLKIIGLLLMVLAFIHAAFPKYFNWKTDLAGMSLINRQMMYIHTLFIGIMVFMIGLLSFVLPDTLCNTPFGRIISTGIGIFWFIRLIVQFVGYSPKLWKGKTFETTMHILFGLFWTYITVVYLWIGISE